MRELVVLVLVLATAACAARPEEGGEPAPELLPSLQATTVDGEVRFVFQVTNTTEEDVELVFPTGQSFELVVRDDAGREVWRWSEDRMFTQAVRRERLGAGETLTYEASWTPPAAARGSYRVEAELTARDRGVSQQAEFTLP